MPEEILATPQYERLSQVYDLDWGTFSSQYLPLLRRLLSERGIAKARVLDLACGTGTLAVALARQGHSVWGIDASPQMIELAREKAEGLPNVRFEVQDMVEFEVEGRFHLVTCTFDAINYLLDPADVQAMLQRLAAVLYKGGQFVFDSNTEAMYGSTYGDVYARELNGQVVRQEIDQDFGRREAIITFDFADGAREVHRQRPYGLHELRRLLADVDLRVVHAWSSFDGAPFGPMSMRLICVAQKG